MPDGEVINMKRLYSTILITALLLIAPIANAGKVVLWTSQEVSGTTLFKSDSGTSVVVVIDQSKFPESFDGIYSLGFPPTVTYADTTADPGGTGNTATSGATLSYFYITINSKDAPTNAQIEALGTSGVTAITGAIPLNSGTTFSVTFPFTPELGKWLFILADTGIVNIHKPGVEVAIQ
jgi:hypothetical protein